MFILRIVFLPGTISHPFPIVKIQRDCIRIGQRWSARIPAEMQTIEMPYFDAMRKERLLDSVPCNSNPSILNFLPIVRVIPEYHEQKAAGQDFQPDGNRKSSDIILLPAQIINWIFRKRTSSITISSVTVDEDPHSPFQRIL